MASSAQIMQALKAADAAGNTKDAQKLAQMYKAARDAEAAPQTRTAAESFGLGVRNIATGLGGVADIVAAPVNTLANTVAGYQRYSRTPYRDVAERTATAIGLPQRGTSGTDLLDHRNFLHLSSYRQS